VTIKMVFDALKNKFKILGQKAFHPFPSK
jgi:hypothetical protein